MNELKEVAAVVERAGFAVVPGVIDEAQIARAVSALERAEHPAGSRRHGSSSGGLYAIRNLLDAVPELRELIDATHVRALAAQVLGAPGFVVRSILFDKTPRANWKVAWHQDLQSRCVRGETPKASARGLRKRASRTCSRPPKSLSAC